MIRKAEKKDLSRIAEILVFDKRMNYRSIFKNDDYSFHVLQVLNVANAISRIINASIPAKYLILFSLCTGWRSLIKNLRKHQRLSPFAVRLPA